MPDHFHGIVIIDRPSVETHCNASLQEYKNKFGPQINNLSSIIRGFKGATTNKIHQAGYDFFAWQPRFYDHVIRNQEEFNGISQYIIDNPKDWGKNDPSLTNPFPHPLSPPPSTVSQGNHQTHFLGKKDH